MKFRAVISTLVPVILFGQVLSYSAIRDEGTVRAYFETKNIKPANNAKVARNLVLKSRWASIGTISTDDVVEGFPMVNIMSIADGIKNGKSTGVIYFLSTTLDFTGKDLLVNKRATLMISDDEDLHCSKENVDPMEPICARAHISGNIVKMNETFPDYTLGLDSLIRLHPAAVNWKKAHSFSLCKVDIYNIYVLDYYGGPNKVSPEEYYSTEPDNDVYNTNKLPRKEQSELKQSLDNFSLKNEVNIRIPRNKFKHINIIL